MDKKDRIAAVLRGLIRSRIQLISLILMAAIVLFIWTNSLQSAAVSTDASMGLLYRLNRFLGLLGLDGLLSEGVLRKIAHAVEFMALGFCVTVAVRTSGKGGRSAVIPVLFTGLMIALCDETIQMRSPGRSAEVRDVWIDFGGFCTGCLAVFLVAAILHWRQNRKPK